MAHIKEFKGLRPSEELIEKVAELPYDVVSKAEAKKIANGNPNSFFHITRPEIDMSEETNPYDISVYKKGKENLEQFIAQNTLIQDSQPALYLYTLIMNGREQTGLVTCVNIDDYINENIKKHELTRKDKEEDRTIHLETLEANTGPVFLLHKEDGSIRPLFDKAKQLDPVYDFTAKDGVRHIFRCITDTQLINDLKSAYKDKILYIADGHHRAASAVNAGKRFRKQNPGKQANDEHNFFLTVIFPDDELMILPYNRAVKDLNGHSPEELINIIQNDFTVEESNTAAPGEIHTFSMYLAEKWYTLKPKFEISQDPLQNLDVSTLQDKILDPILGIKDPRTDTRITFVGGIRGTKELEKMVNDDGFEVAFSLYPTTVEQLINIADNNSIMPPKSTWFEPKLRSGIVVHLLKN